MAHKNYVNTGRGIPIVLGGTVYAGDSIRKSGGLAYQQRDSETAGIDGIANEGGVTGATITYNALVHVIRAKAGAGVSFAVGDYCYCTGTENTYDAGTQSDVAAGECVGATAAAGGYFDMLVLPKFTGNPPTHA